MRDLRSFLAVAETLHFTRAAETLHVSQPVLSKQIRALERLLGTQLFDRTRRSVALTTAGAAFVPASRAVVTAWDAARRELARVATGSLVVEMQTSPGRGLLPRVRARLSADCPEAELTLRQVGWEDPTAGLADHSCDAAFVWLPLSRRTDFEWLTIAREPRFVALPAMHRLAARAAVRMHDLRDEPFLALPAGGPEMRDFWLAIEQREGHPVTMAAEIRDTEEAYEAVASGVGVCIVAEGNIPILDRGDVAMRQVIDLPPAELVLAWRRGDRGLLLDHFTALCSEVSDEPKVTAA